MSLTSCFYFGVKFLSFGALALIAHGFSTMVLAYSRGMAENLLSGDGGGGSGSGKVKGTDQFDRFGGSNEQDSFFGRKDEEEEDLPQVIFIVPTFNEQICIEKTLERLKTLVPKAQEIIVVDGGSLDETINLAKKMGVTVINSTKKGRSIQLNHGAKLAIENMKSKADGILCFVHADTIVPVDSVSIVRKVLSKERTVCGGFVSIIKVQGGIYWGFSLQNVMKTWLVPFISRPISFFRGFRWLFGDQVIFCRSSDFISVGGFDESLPIMEDANLCEKLHLKGPQKGKGRGDIKLVNRIVVTSGRRIKSWGFLKSTFVYYSLGFSFAFGTPASQVLEMYKKWYNDVR